MKLNIEDLLPKSKEDWREQFEAAMLVVHKNQSVLSDLVKRLTASDSPTDMLLHSVCENTDNVLTALAMTGREDLFVRTVYECVRVATIRGYMTGMLQGTIAATRNGEETLDIAQVKRHAELLGFVLAPRHGATCKSCNGELIFSRKGEWIHASEREAFCCFNTEVRL